jgi:hypothetical protein
MIRIDGIEIAMEGSFGTLIREAARAVHTVAKAASEKFKEDGDEVDYNMVVEYILEELSKLKAFDKDDDSVIDLPKEIEEDFFKQLREVRESNGHKPNFIDYDTQKPDPNAGKKIIESAIKDVFLDPRGNTLDLEDLKAIKKAGKKKKK